MILQTPAIVLKSFDFRETSRIVTFFTRDFGKIKGILKGIRKDPKKFGSSVDRFTVNDIVFYHHRHRDLHLVGQCDMREYFGPVRQDLKRMSAASYILELVDVVMPPEEKNEDVYRMMVDFLTSLQAAPDVSKLVHMFQIKILRLSGFRPHLDSCVKCNAPIKGQARFSMNLGGLVCLACQVEPAHIMPISRGAVASILHIEQNDWQRSLRLALSVPIKNELKYILNNFLVFHMERHLKSARYLA